MNDFKSRYKTFKKKDYDEFSDGVFRTDKRFDILYKLFLYIIEKKAKIIFKDKVCKALKPKKVAKVKIYKLTGVKFAKADYILNQNDPELNTIWF